jgi:2'-5' RNA ligase
VSGVRCFVALELQPEIVSALVAAGSALRGAAPAWRDEKWVAEDNLHITLKFLGPVAEERIELLELALGVVLADQPAFSLRLAGLRAVPSAKRCSMVWAPFDDSPDPACQRLAEAVDAAIAEFGVEKESRRFAPHVTLARARRPHRLDEDALLAANTSLTCTNASMSVPSATLFASTLTRRGPIYERLARWQFTAAG